ncbi:adenosine amp deaminase domain-containing protein [Cyclospora cayetanensis]|uniref:Adenosine amp deaminase domain-containing protein n=1 Tax=Cyclospora cayetanensis TaxID=88456 RepID=A0A1D3CU82_9EIME|nr:adenosine amp deaminase domain-containing protein [Cyclospora cayetanensis]
MLPNGVSECCGGNKNGKGEGSSGSEKEIKAGVMEEGSGRERSAALDLEDLMKIPKVELHAHFFGSIRLETVKRIEESKAARARTQKGQIKEKATEGGNCCTEEVTEEVHSPNNDKHKITSNGGSSNRNCRSVSKSIHTGTPNCPDLIAAFDYFTWVYSAVRAADDMRQALLEVLEDFHKENVVYLELRSSLKRIPDEGIDPQSYVDLLVEGCKEAKRKWEMSVRLLISLDRGRMDTEENANLQIEEAFAAAERHPDWIVGFDIAGRPDKGSIELTLQRLKEEVISEGGKFYKKKKITIHTAETLDAEAETEEILKLPPHRLGHGCYLTAEEQRAVVDSGICVEVCPTSNICTLKLRDLQDHPLQLQQGNILGLQNICICTDDIVPAMRNTRIAQLNPLWLA